MTMPIRFPTEAANDPDGKLDGLPESTGEDDTLRSSPGAAPERQDRGAGTEQRREQGRDSAPSSGKDKDAGRDKR
jgi:hypothetical protein